LTTQNSYLDFTPEITVFLPSDSAIITGLACNQNQTLDIARLLRAHVVSGFTAYSPSLVEGLQIRTQDGSFLDITTDPKGAIFVNKARVIKSDIIIKNGVVHVIDRVIHSSSES
jgi:uncharacterized surface protein with fasciclin (FAS1) repeats